MFCLALNCLSKICVGFKYALYTKPMVLTVKQDSSCTVRLVWKVKRPLPSGMISKAKKILTSNMLMCVTVCSRNYVLSSHILLCSTIQVLQMVYQLSCGHT